MDTKPKGPIRHDRVDGIADARDSGRAARELAPERDRSIRGLRKSFGELAVIDGLSCDFPAGETTAILGPSGCGKTTLLNILSGLSSADSGELIGFEGARPSFVFQEPRLLPWRTALENIVLPLETVMDTAEAEERARDYVALVGLSGFERHYPGKLSGGMRQRVSLARAFAYPGDPLLLDEPFQALDLKLRLEILDLFRALQARSGRSAVFVTHDPLEALYLGDSIIVLTERPARLRMTMRVDPELKKLGYGKQGAAEAELYSAILS